MVTIDEIMVRAPVETMFALASDVASWPTHLPHYRYVRFRTRARDGGGIVEMSANRSFGPLPWPTWWVSEMQVRTDASPAVRFRHIDGVTAGMDVEWQFTAMPGGAHVRIVHAWNGPRWPLVGSLAARGVIGPVFVHGIASRTLAGLSHAAERIADRGGVPNQPQHQRGTA
jgi:ribosome-associated toxin RatA of RatAB toxin-antitoxin module